jgi:hypothetical protein
LAVPGSQSGVAVVNGSTYGVAIYTASDAMTSNSYAPEGYMFVCLGLVGPQFASVTQDGQADSALPPNFVLFKRATHVLPVWLVRMCPSNGPNYFSDDSSARGGIYGTSGARRVRSAMRRPQGAGPPRAAPGCCGATQATVLGCRLVRVGKSPQRRRRVESGSEARRAEGGSCGSIAPAQRVQTTGLHSGGPSRRYFRGDT